MFFVFSFLLGSLTIYRSIELQFKDMQVSNPNNVKIYNLSAGKSLPEVGQNISDAHTAAITGDFQNVITQS